MNSKGEKYVLFNLVSRVMGVSILFPNHKICEYEFAHLV